MLLGAIVAIVGAIVAAGSVVVMWAATSGVTPGTPQAAFDEMVDYAYVGSGGVVGVGIFLAALGLAFHGPRTNIWFLLGGALVLIGSVGSASVSMYVQSLFFGGHFPGVQAFSELTTISTAMAVLEPAGIGILLLGFVLPRGSSWMR